MVNLVYDLSKNRTNRYGAIGLHLSLEKVGLNINEVSIVNNKK
jgi:hypothetical protein